MSLKFLIIDDDVSIRSLLKKQLAKKWPDSVIESYDPVKKGIPDKKFAWEKYDVVLLDYDLGFDSHTGIDTLEQIKNGGNSPIVIMVTGEGGADIAVKAIKSGAENYLVKYDVVTDKFYEIINEALALRKNTENFVNNIKYKLNVENENIDLFLSRVDENVIKYVIPNYNFITTISQSASTTIFAENITTKEQVVIKIQDVDEDKTSTSTKRFMQEIAILSKITHPNIIKIIHYDFEEKYAYYIMPYYKNGDLTSKIKDIAVEGPELKKMMLDIANGLYVLHKNNIIHRDLKPHNVLINEKGDLVIADLGVAKDIKVDDEMTMRGEMLGTPYYMSPEQFSDKEVDRKSDIYSLGVIYYRLITGKLPFYGKNLTEIIFKHAFESVPELSDDKKVFSELINKMLEKNPGDRYQNIDEIIQYINNIDF